MKTTTKIYSTLALSILLGFTVNADQTTSYTYNSFGQVLTIDGPRTDVTDVTTYTYDTSGNVATITNAVGHVTQFTSYDGAGRPLTIIDANGVTTELTYTPRGWLATSTIKGPSGQTSLDATTTYTYDSAGRVTQIDMPNGTTIDFEYDDAGRLTAIENALGERIEYTLDAAGNRTGEVIKDDLGTIQKTLTQTFDELSRLRSIVGASNQTTTFDYDVNDNQTEVVDGRNNDTDSAFDALNRLTTITDADLNDASMGYDSRDRLTSVTDQRNLVTNYVYDAYDNLTSLQSPDTGTTTFTHDDAGNVLTKTDAEGIVTNYNYDALNRLLTVSYPAYSAHNITFTYDDTTNGNFGEGRLTSVSDASGSTAYVYDYQGNITEVTTTIGSDSYTVSYAYDLAGNQTQITYPDGRTLDYTRDASGQITAVDTTQGVTTTAIASSISYKPFGPVSGLTYGNNLDLSVTFDQDYRLTGIDVDTGTVQDLDYTHDAANNIDGKTDGTGSELDTTYTYDNLNRLTDAATTAGSKVYSYDAVSNRTSFINESNQTDSYAYDSLSNRLSTITEPADTQTYAYDYNGNIISRTDTAGEGMVYIHTPDNRLAEINEKVLEGGSIATYVIATYQYNAAGQRVSKTVGGVTTHYVYHLDGSMLYETTTSATNSTHYLSMHTGGLPQGLALVVNDSSQSLTDAILFQHNDHLATPKVLTDSAGAIVWQASHTPFGEATVNTDVDNDGTYFVLNTRFPGQYYDDESGLHYNWHRYYDTRTGRYITSDPIGLAGGMNTYGYVDGDPLNFTDPNGNAKVRSSFVRDPSWNMQETRRQRLLFNQTPAGKREAILNNYLRGMARKLDSTCFKNSLPEMKEIFDDWIIYVDPNIDSYQLRGVDYAYTHFGSRQTQFNYWFFKDPSATTFYHEFRHMMRDNDILSDSRDTASFLTDSDDYPPIEKDADDWAKAFLLDDCSCFN